MRPSFFLFTLKEGAQQRRREGLELTPRLRLQLTSRSVACCRHRSGTSALLLVGAAGARPPWIDVATPAACGSGRRPCGYPDESNPPLPGLRHPGLLATPLFSIPFVPSSGRGVFRRSQCSAGSATAIVILARPLARGLSRRHRGFPGAGLPATLNPFVHGRSNSRRPPLIRQGSGGFLRSDLRSHACV